MSEIDLEAVRGAMFVHPGLKAVDELRIYRCADGGIGIAATLTVAVPDVDLALVQATVRKVLEEQFAVAEVDLRFKDPGPLPAPPTGGAVEKE
ncbi:hypothetical protein L3D22_07420 [Lysobacter soli]|uniref:hypothetical protein n=1 Tax=Lysobacter soli TaxID=453783 RepID=UPI0020A0D0B0|nr:hypothetical protein [Lysobacter soli]UTA55622.1 hypothetical protein L3D22_07420 [Lysobacter soli]